MTKIALIIPGTDFPISSPVGPSGNFTFNNLIQNGLTFIFVIAAIVALLFLILGGIRWIISGGDSKQLEGAKQTITYAIVGLVIIFSSFFIVSFIGKTFGVNLLNTTLKTEKGSKCPSGTHLECHRNCACFPDK